MKLAKDKMEKLCNNAFNSFVLANVVLSYKRRKIQVVGVLDTSANLCAVSESTAEKLGLEKHMDMVVGVHGSGPNAVVKNWYSKPVSVRIGGEGSGSVSNTGLSVVAESPKFRVSLGVLDSPLLTSGIVGAVLGIDVLHYGRALLDFGGKYPVVYWGFDSSKTVKVPCLGVLV